MPTKKTASKTTASKTTAAKTTAAKKTAPITETPFSMTPVETAAAAHQETFETVVKAGTQAATKGYEQAIAIAQEQVEKASETIFKRYDEVATLNKDNVDAYVASTTVIAKGVESMGKELMSIAQSAVEANVANTKAIFGVKTVRELIDLQTEFQRSRFDSLVAESAKLTELSLTLANDAIAPIQARMNVTVEMLMKPAVA